MLARTVTVHSSSPRTLAGRLVARESLAPLQVHSRSSPQSQSLLPYDILSSTSSSSGWSGCNPGKWILDITYHDDSRGSNINIPLAVLSRSQKNPRSAWASNTRLSIKFSKDTQDYSPNKAVPFVTIGYIQLFPPFSHELLEFQIVLLQACSIDVVNRWPTYSCHCGPGPLQCCELSLTAFCFHRPGPPLILYLQDQYKFK